MVFAGASYVVRTRRTLIFSLLFVVCPSACFTGHIGLLTRLTDMNRNSLGAFWKGVAAVQIMAVNHINERNSALVPEAAKLPPDFNLTYAVGDTQSSPPAGVKSALELTQAGAHVLVGAVRSAVSGPASLVAGMFDVPVISYASTSTELADKNSYPFFSRTCPSDALTARAMVQTVESFGWRSVAIMAMDDHYGRGFAQELESSCAALGIDVSANVRYVVADDGSMQVALDAIKLAGARVLLLVIFETDFQVLVPLAHAAGLVGKGYSWVLSDSVSDPAGVISSAQLVDPALLKEFAAGFLSVYPLTLDSAQQQAMQAVWQQEDKALVLPPDTLASELEGQSMISVHAHAYEAVWLAALALAQSYVAGPNGSHVLDASSLNGQVRRQPFTGPTGRVELEPDSGDRSAASVLYQVLNWKPTIRTEDTPPDAPVMQAVAVWHWTGSELVRVDNATLPFWPGVGERWKPPPDGASCKPGSVLSESTLECVPCAKGKYQDGGQCVECEVGTVGPEEGLTKCIGCERGYADREGMETCRECPANTVRSAGSAGVAQEECECTFGHYAPGGPGSVCEPCFAGARCEGGRLLPEPMSGFWGDRDCISDPECGGESRFFSCVPASQCRGDYECERGHTGRLCQDVAPGFFVVGGRWHYECGANGKLINFVGILAVIAMWTGIKKVAASNYYALRIALLYVQITGLVASFGMRWHRIVDYVNTALSIFNFDIDFMSPHCIGTWTVHHRFYIQLLLPFIYVILYAASNVAMQVPAMLGLRGPRRTLREVVTDADANDDVVRSGLSFGILVYHTLCVRCFSAFRCRKYPDGESYMVFAPEVQCWQPMHVGMVVVSAFYIPLVLVGLPVFMFYVVQSAKREGRLHEPKLMARYGFFYVRYRTEYKFWEVLIMVRRAMIALVFAAVEQPMVQAAVAVVVLLILLMAHTHFQPFVMTRIDYLEIFTLCGSILYALAGMLFFPSLTENAQGVLCLTDEENEACHAEGRLKLGIAIILLLWFGSTLVLALVIAGYNISETTYQQLARKTIKALIPAQGPGDEPPTPQQGRDPEAGPRSDDSEDASPLNQIQAGSSSMRWLGASPNQVPLQALLSGQRLLRWAKHVKEASEAEHEAAIREWNSVAGVVHGLRTDVTHFSNTHTAATLRVLAGLPAIEDYLRESSGEERSNMLRLVERYSEFRERAQQQHSDGDGASMQRYYAAGLVDQEHKPVMLYAMMTCAEDEHATLVTLLDAILAASGPPSGAASSLHAASNGGHLKGSRADPPAGAANGAGAHQPFEVTAQVGTAARLREVDSRDVAPSGVPMIPRQAVPQPARARSSDDDVTPRPDAER